MDGARAFAGEAVGTAGDSKLYILVFVLPIAYAAGTIVIGNTIATGIFFPVVLYVLGTRDWRVNIASSLALTAIIYALFVRLADMPLPRGWLEVT